MQYYDSQGRPPVPEMKDRVTVPGRDEVGEIVDPGKNIGSVYAVGVHFPDTGELAYYDRARVTPAQ